MGAGADPGVLAAGPRALAARPAQHQHGRAGLLHLLRTPQNPAADLARIAGTRWAVEECFQQAKGQAGLDEYQVRDWRAWHAHITLSMAALAWLVVARTATAKGEPATATGR